MESNTKTIQAFTPSADQRLARGKLVTLATTIATLLASATAKPHGVILDGQDPTDNPNAQSSIGLLGGNLGIVKLKAGGAVTKFGNVMTKNDGTVLNDSGTGARVLVALALEDAVSGELFDAITYKPRVLGAGTGLSVIALPINLASITGAGDVLTNITPGFAFEVVSLDFAVTVPVTTAAKLASLNAEIGTTNVTGGVVALTSANCTPLGAAVAGSAITAANTGSATDTLSIEAASVTAFSEGAGVLLIKLRNLDTLNAA